MSPALPKLVTFGPMIDSETSRLILSRYRIRYEEERHIFGWVSVLTLLRYGSLQIPVLAGVKPSLVGPMAIVDHFEDTCPAEYILLPAGEPRRAHVLADWARFNGGLATHTAKLAYFHLLPHPDILIEPFVRGIPAAEAKLVPALYPALRATFNLLLGLSAAAADDAWVQTQLALDLVDARLADGRPFLTGDRLTLSDLSLAAAIGPLLLPVGYSAPIPPLERMPQGLQRIVEACRQRPTAALVTRVYAARLADDAAAGVGQVTTA
jgi:glutathione S-transferase